MKEIERKIRPMGKAFICMPTRRNTKEIGWTTNRRDLESRPGPMVHNMRVNIRMEKNMEMAN